MANVTNIVPAVELCSGIHEHDMDLLFIEEFCISKAFSDLFMSKIGIDDYQITNVIHSQYEEGNGIDVETQSRLVRDENVDIDSRGESDITVLYTVNGHVRALLIEDKINAPQQPDQRLRYDARGNKAVKDGKYEGFDVFLVAPSSYYADEYENKVTYEEIKSYFENINTPRSSYKLTLINKALEKKSHSGIIIPSENVMDFYDGYVRFVKDNHPSFPLITKGGQERGSKSNWFQYETGINNVDLVHQTLRKVISVQINFGKENAERKSITLRNWLVDNIGNLSTYGLSYNVNKSSVSLKLEVPMLNTGDSIYNQIDAVETCFAGMEQMLEFTKQLRDKGLARLLTSMK